jgi:replicative DNA helicase
MKILAEAKAGFDIQEALRLIKEEYKIEVKDSMARNIELRYQETFIILAETYKDMSFILLDDEDNIIGWR